MKKIVWMAAFLVYATNANAAELFTEKEEQKMMELTLANFWGKAIDSKGEPVMPKDEKERATMPISKEQAHHVISKGGESGLAQWCGVPWEERYQLIIAQLKQHLTSDTQVAYAGVLHGLAQQMMLVSMKNETCDDESKAQVAGIIKEDLKNLRQSVANKE